MTGCLVGWLDYWCVRFFVVVLRARNFFFQSEARRCEQVATKLLPMSANSGNEIMHHANCCVGVCETLSPCHIRWYIAGSSPCWSQHTTHFTQANIYKQYNFEILYQTKYSCKKTAITYLSAKVSDDPLQITVKQVGNERGENETEM